jgi:hypothetical protein
MEKFESASLNLFLKWKFYRSRLGIPNPQVVEQNGPGEAALMTEVNRSSFPNDALEEF